MRPRLVAGAIVVVAMVAVWAGPGRSTVAADVGPDGDARAAAPGGPTTTSGIPALTVADAAPGVSLLPSFPTPEVLAAFEDFVASVNAGDAAAVAGRLVAVLPDLHGVGTSEWPLLPTDAGLWSAGALDRERVEGFVSYLAGLSSSIRISGCESWGGGPKALLATCAYETSGGVLERLGLPAERGHLHGVMVGTEVAGIVRHGSVDLEAWARVAEWIAVAHPEATRVLGVATTGASQWHVDAVYSADAAAIHLALAAEMASADRGAHPEAGGAHPERARSTSGIVR